MSDDPKVSAIEAVCDRLAGAIEDLDIAGRVGTSESIATRRMALENAIMAFAVEIIKR
jgi:hypothetical protein